MKNHFRKVLKSDHLGCADLEDMLEAGQSLIFTIKEVRQQYGVSVAGKKGDHNIAYFVEPIKPLVLNATNAKVIKGFAGGSPFVEDWNNIRVELYIDENVKMKGEVVGGVRIRPVQPKAKELPIFTEAMFEKASAKNATIESIQKHYIVTDEIKAKYVDYLNSKM
jgi:hypothetical protein